MQTLQQLESKRMELQRAWDSRRPFTGYDITRKLNAIERRIKDHLRKYGWAMR